MEKLKCTRSKGSNLAKQSFLQIEMKKWVTSEVLRSQQLVTAKTQSQLCSSSSS